MGESRSQGSDRKRRRTDHGRLDSWKAIASYFNKSVRTVRRWEAHEDLPVHRHQHTKGTSVYAYCAELDAWQENHQQPVSDAPIAEKAKKPVSLRAVSSYSVIAVVAIAIGIFVGRHWPLADADRIDRLASPTSWVLISAPVSNSTLQELDDSFVAELRRQISHRNHIGILPQRHVEGMLRLMRKDPKTELTPAIAAEVALRDGRVSTVLVPRLEQIGDSYVLSVEIVDPHADRLIAFPSERGQGAEDSVMPALQELARRVEAGLRRLPSKQARERLPRVTTSSMTALRLYSRATGSLLADRPRSAMELLSLALEEDSEFASAHALLALAMMRAGLSSEVYLRVSNTAASIDVLISTPERYFVNGMHQFLSKHLIAAETSYRTLLEIEPEHVFAAEALVTLCESFRKGSTCADEKTFVAEHWPNHFESNVSAAWALAAKGTNPERASYFAIRSKEIMRAARDTLDPVSVARVMALPIVTSWSDGDSAAALQRSQDLRNTLDTLPAEVRNLVIEHLVATYLALGRIGDASEILAQLQDPTRRYELEATILFAAGETDALRTHLALRESYGSPLAAFLLSVAGLENKVGLSDDSLSGALSGAQRAVILAITARSGDRVAYAKSQLHSAVGELTARDGAFYFIGLDLLAKILQKEGRLGEAISMLERTTSKRNEGAFNHAGLLWLLCQRQLADLYREAGKEQQAVAIEDTLRNTLFFADEQFPLLRSLNEA